MNFLQIFGRLGADPETRFTSNGQKVTTFRVACNVRKGGKEDTMWWRVTVWGERFDKMMAYLKKGSAVIVMGAMGKPEIYTSRDGTPQVSLEITAESIHFSPFGSGRTDQSGTGGEAGNYGEVNQAPTHSFASVSEEFEDEPIPF
jgi:single-strand DNA-binding protein